jgi:hypothetical protein
MPACSSGEVIQFAADADKRFEAQACKPMLNVVLYPSPLGES